VGKKSEVGSRRSECGGLKIMAIQNIIKSIDTILFKKKSLIPNVCLFHYDDTLKQIIN